MQTTHAANAIYTLEKAGFTLSEFQAFWGAALFTQKGGNGDRWYSCAQIQDFINERIN